MLAKNEIISNLVSLNDELTLKIQDFQSERLKVLRQKQHCEELFSYFQEKSEQIVLMSARVGRLVNENEQYKILLKKMLFQLKDITESEE